jgi:hypothetical protein
MSVIQKFFLALFILSAIVGCQSSSGSREPSSAYEFDPVKVKLLEWAAQNRILFQVSDQTLSDVASSQIQDSCKDLKDPVWSQIVFSTLETIKKNSALQNKIHVIEVKRADVPAVETSKDLDGITYFTLKYSLNEKKSVVTSPDQIPCENKTNSYVGEELTETSFNTPTVAMISKTLKDMPNRVTPDRWKFNVDFLKHLAVKMTVLKFTPELGFERAADGQSFFVQFLNDQAAALKNNKDYVAFDYWLSEITQRSHTGSYLKVVALVQDKQLNYGMGVTQNTKTLAYPFMSYKSLDGHYTYTSLGKLNQCLEELSSRYKRGLASIRSDYSTQADTFLYPGYVCHTENP